MNKLDFMATCATCLRDVIVVRSICNLIKYVTVRPVYRPYRPYKPMTRTYEYDEEKENEDE